MSAPKPGADWRIWANQLAAYLRRIQGVLERKTSGSIAGQDGVILWDKTGYPVVTRSGAFVRISMQVAAPGSATASGEAGQWAYDADYIYICTAADTWKRVAIATWP